MPKVAVQSLTARIRPSQLQEHNIAIVSQMPHSPTPAGNEQGSSRKRNKLLSADHSQLLTGNNPCRS